MTRIKVNFRGGESRYTPGKAVDYMIASTKIDGQEIELCAETENPTWDEEKEEFEDETSTYAELKKEILRQAEEAGIPESGLDFIYG